MGDRTHLENFRPLTADDSGMHFARSDHAECMSMPNREEDLAIGVFSKAGV